MLTRVRRTVAAGWRPLVIIGALLATVPLWPRFEADELAVLLAFVLLVPLTWMALAGNSTSGPQVAAALVVCAIGWTVATQLWASWATPSTVDDVLRVYLAVGCSVIMIALWRERRRTLLWHRSRSGLILLALLCAAVAAVPVVGNAPVPDREALLPLPDGLAIATEEAGCDWPGSCERRFEVAVGDGANPADVQSQLIRHLERRGWEIGVQHQDKACQPLGYIANPYRSCVTVHYLRGRGTVEVLFAIYNPRQPWIVDAHVSAPTGIVGVSRVP